MSAKRLTKKDRIVEELRRLIDSGEIERGARVQQDELAARFDTSITPVREAMRQLEAEGLLVSEPHRGVRVATADLEEVKAVYIARRFLEPYAAQRAALRVSRRDLDRAEELNKAIVKARAESDDRTVGEANREFHFFLYERCGVPALTEMIKDLWLGYPWDILHVLGPRADESLREHKSMLSAMKKGDLERVKTTFESHLSKSYLALAEHLTGERPADPFDPYVD